MCLKFYESRLVPLRSEQPWNDWGINIFFFSSSSSFKNNHLKCNFSGFIYALVFLSACIIFKHIFTRRLIISQNLKCSYNWWVLLKFSTIITWNEQVCLHNKKINKLLSYLLQNNLNEIFLLNFENCLFFLLK